VRDPKIGDDVRIIDGPFLDFVGRVVDLHSAERKVKVVTQLFRKPTPVELDFEQVQVLTEPA
jgi:transcriptional antiterminator NusG